MQRNTRKNRRDRRTRCDRRNLLRTGRFEVINTQCANAHAKLYTANRMELIAMQLDRKTVSLRLIEDVLRFTDLPSFLLNENIDCRSQLAPRQPPESAPQAPATDTSSARQRARAEYE